MPKRESNASGLSWESKENQIPKGSLRLTVMSGDKNPGKDKVCQILVCDPFSGKDGAVAIKPDAISSVCLAVPFSVPKIPSSE